MANRIKAAQILTAASLELVASKGKLSPSATCKGCQQRQVTGCVCPFRAPKFLPLWAHHTKTILSIPALFAKRPQLMERLGSGDSYTYSYKIIVKIVKLHATYVLMPLLKVHRLSAASGRCKSGAIWWPSYCQNPIQMTWTRQSVKIKTLNALKSYSLVPTRWWSLWHIFPSGRRWAKC